MNKVIITFINNNTYHVPAQLMEYEIVSCRGAYTTLGFSVSADIRGAIKRVAK